MDTLVLSIIALAGICAYVFCTMRMRASFSLSLFSWMVAIPWLTLYAVRNLMSLDNAQVISWQGNAEMGPITLILAVIGLSLVTAGGKRNVSSTIV
jgi:uncharacterized protein YebE (UPF0316 family)